MVALDLGAGLLMRDQDWRERGVNHCGRVCGCWMERAIDGW